MVNCNPETVSTDYDTSDRLYFEPITEEDVLAVVDAERRAGGGGVAGVIVGLGGQTPLKLAGRLPAELVLGTSAASIDLAEDRERWSALCVRLEIPQPAGGTARSLAEARAVVDRIGYPALVRPSYVLGGRAMEIVYDDEGLEHAMAALAGFDAPAGGGSGGAGSLGREGGLSAERPVLVDRFLEDAIEVDVDAIRDSAGEVLIGGVMEHVEEAGVHSGDSACVIPPPTLDAATIAVLEGYTRAIADALEVRRPDQRAVRGEAGPGVRDRGEPSGLAHGALRRQGHRASRSPRSRPASWSARPSQSCGTRGSCGLPVRTAPATSASRRRCSPSTAFPTSTRCSARRCARPAR